MHVGCECNVVIATCPQRDLESTFLRCDNVAFTTLPQPKHNVVTTLSQRDFVCWVASINRPAFTPRALTFAQLVGNWLLCLIHTRLPVLYTVVRIVGIRVLRCSIYLFILPLL